MSLTWTADQQRAIDIIGEWWERDPEDYINAGYGSDVIAIDGYAGTGKTTLAAQLPELLGCEQGNLLYLTPTGKAASVLRTKGMPAKTIHSAIFKPIDRRDKIEELESRLELATGGARERVAEELLSLTETVDFFTTEDNTDDEVKAVVVDERSMVDEWLSQKLFDRFPKIVMFGDPFQLPPVRGNPCPVRPAHTLREVRRHAGPLLEAVTMLRNGENLRGFENEAFAWSTASKAPDGFIDADVIACYMNRTRREVNQRLRSRAGHTGRPREAEPLVVLQNNYGADMWNGEQWRLAADADVLDPVTLQLRFKGREDRPIEAELARFKPSAMLPRKEALKVRDERRGFELRGNPLQCDYGYAMTVHKLQGSELPHVSVLLDHPHPRGEEFQRWLYTATTRAQRRVMIHVR